MYLIEDVRLASPTQLAAIQKHRQFFASPMSKDYRPPVRIVEPEPITEPVMVRKFMPGFAGDIVKAACVVCGEKYHVEPRDVIGRVQAAQIVKARHAVIYILRNITLWSLPEIGRRVGGRDHTTILHALRKYERLKNDSEAMAVIKTLKAKTIEYLKENGVEIAVSPFSERHVFEQQRKGEGATVVPGGKGVEGGSSMDNQIAETAEV